MNDKQVAKELLRLAKNIISKDEKTHSSADLMKVADQIANDFKKDLRKKVSNLAGYPMDHPIDFVAAVGLEICNRNFSDPATRKALKKLKKSSVWLKMF